MSPCIGNTPSGWSIISAAEAQSQLASVVAGFVFAGLLLLLQTPEARKSTLLSAQTFALLPVVFVILLIVSFLFGVISGEQICARASVLSVVTGMALSMGGSGMLLCVAWLFDVFDLPRFAAQYAALVTLIVTIVAAVQVSLSIGDAEWWAVPVHLRSTVGYELARDVVLVHLVRATTVLGVAILISIYLGDTQSSIKWRQRFGAIFSISSTLMLLIIVGHVVWIEMLPRASWSFESLATAPPVFRWVNGAFASSLYYVLGLAVLAAPLDWPWRNAARAISYALRSAAWRIRATKQ